MTMFRMGLLVATSLLLACARRAPPPVQDEAPTAAAAPEPEVKLAPGLRFVVEPAEAEILIDEKSYGAAGELGHVALPPGIYRVSIRARGYTTWRAEVSVSDSAESLEVSLTPRQ